MTLSCCRDTSCHHHSQLRRGDGTLDHIHDEHPSTRTITSWWRDSHTHTQKHSVWNTQVQVFFIKVFNSTHNKKCIFSVNGNWNCLNLITFQKFTFTALYFPVNLIEMPSCMKCAMNCCILVHRSVSDSFNLNKFLVQLLKFRRHLNMWKCLYC